MNIFKKISSMNIFTEWSLKELNEAIFSPKVIDIDVKIEEIKQKLPPCILVIR